MIRGVIVATLLLLLLSGVQVSSWDPPRATVASAQESVLQSHDFTVEGGDFRLFVATILTIVIVAGGTQGSSELRNTFARPSSFLPVMIGKARGRHALAATGSSEIRGGLWFLGSPSSPHQGVDIGNKRIAGRRTVRHIKSSLGDSANNDAFDLMEWRFTIDCQRRDLAALT